MRSPVSSPRLSDEVSTLLSSTWHRNHIPNILIPVCVYLWDRMLPVLSPSYLWFLCLSMILRPDRQIKLLHRAVLHALRNTTRANGKLLFALAFLVILRGIWFKSIALTIKMPALMLSSHSSTPGNCITSIQRTHNFINSHTAWHVSESSTLCRLPAVPIT